MEFRFPVIVADTINRIYLPVLVIDFLLIILAARKIKIKKEDVVPILLILVVSLFPLFFEISRFTHTMMLGYANVADVIAQTFESRYCLAYSSGVCEVSQSFFRPPGFSFLAAPLVLLGVRAFDAVIIINFILNIAATALFYLTSKKLVGKTNALIATPMFIFLISKVQTYLSIISEPSAMFFLLMFLYFLIDYLEKGKFFNELCASLIFFLNTRIENYVIVFPVLVIIIIKFFKELKKADKKNMAFLGFLIFNLALVVTLSKSEVASPHWTPTLDAVLNEIQVKGYSNVLFFFDLDLFNPLVSVIALYGILKLLRTRQAVPSAMLLMFLIAFLLVSLIDLDGGMREFSGMRFSLLPSTLLILFSISFLKKQKAVLLTLSLISIILFIQSPFSRFAEEKGLIEYFQEDSAGLKNYETLIVRNADPYIIHMIFPDKRVIHNVLPNVNPNIKMLLNGSAYLFIPARMTDEFPFDCEYELLGGFDMHEEKFPIRVYELGGCS